MEAKMSGDFQHKTYRVEWRTEVYQEDQYGRREQDAKPFYSKPWPNRELAGEDLERIAKPSPYVQGRWVSDLATNEYHGCGIFYHEVDLKVGGAA